MINTNNDILESPQQSDALPASGSWLADLIRDENGRLINSLRNILIILENDDYMRSIVYNMLADKLEIKGEVPWSHPGPFWRDADDAQLICYVDGTYGSFSARNYEIAIKKVADDRSYHPIREYFDSLPPWDGIACVETCIIDYLGADDNDYTRAITRKTLCAAHERIYRPGVKFDYLPVLVGPQGSGKSTFIAKLGMAWFSDNLCISDMNDKTAAEKLQGYWIIEISELAGIKNVDIDKMKSFITRQDDNYRAAFAKRVTSHPRQCIFIGTTNNEEGYLRDTTGNRRYWNVPISGKGKYKPWDMTQEIVDQIWAEVATLCKDAREDLFLLPELEACAKEGQLMAMVHDDREGLVQNYLETPLPEIWDKMDIDSRLDYLSEEPGSAIDTHKRTEVSNIEVWCECFGKAKEDMKPEDSRTIATIMARIPGWEKTGIRKRLPIYGQQRMYYRKECDKSS